jgi:hypothetical protein
MLIAWRKANLETPFSERTSRSGGSSGGCARPPGSLRRSLPRGQALRARRLACWSVARGNAPTRTRCARWRTLWASPRTKRYPPRCRSCSAEAHPPKPDHSRPIKPVASYRVQLGHSLKPLYCNRASTSWYAADDVPSVILQNTCKTSKSPDALGGTRKCWSAFARRRSGVRLPSAPLQKQGFCRKNTWQRCRLRTGWLPNTAHRRQEGDEDTIRNRWLLLASSRRSGGSFLGFRARVGRATHAYPAPPLLEDVRRRTVLDHRLAGVLQERYKALP